MKKMLFLAAATLTLAACSNDDNYIDQQVEAQIRATIRNTAVSRASQAKWDVGDEIGITMAGKLVSYINQKYTADTEDGVFSGEPMYFKNHTDPLTLTAYYPFTGDEGAAPGVIETDTKAVRQNADDQTKFDFLFASLDNVTGGNPNVEFTFSHRMSKLTLIFISGKGSDVSKITSYKIDGLFLDGTFNTATGDCAAKSESPAESLEMSLGEGVVQDGQPLPSLILFPQSTADKTVRLKISDSEGQDYACTLSFDNDILESGNNYQFKITVNKTGLTLNQSSITDWNNIDSSENNNAESDWKN